MREPHQPAAASCDLSVVIPCFNEEERIASTVSLITTYLDGQGGSYEVIVSDDGSHDGGPGAVRQLSAGHGRVRLIRERQNLGKGAAVRKGVLAARGEIIVFTDADLAYPVETIGECTRALEAHDVAVGSRNLPGSRIEVRPSVLRRLSGAAFKSLVRHTAVSGFSDTQCGFKGFRSAAAMKIFNHCEANGFAFDVEVLALARAFGYRITEVPVRLQLDSSDSTINLTTDPLRMVAELLEIRRRINRLKAKPLSPGNQRTSS